MLFVQNHIQQSFPILQGTDKIGFALQLMDDYDVLHLPVEQDNTYVGLVAKEDLLDEEEDNRVIVLQHKFLPHFVSSKDLALQAIEKMAAKQLSLIAVVSDSSEVLGVITQQTALSIAQQILGLQNNHHAIIMVEAEPRQFSFGEINRLVETNNATITQLNTITNKDTGIVTILLQLNTPEVSDVVSTLQRYEYNVVYYKGEEAYANEIKENYNHLMAYLNI